jgi:hypothetical protein
MYANSGNLALDALIYCANSKYMCLCTRSETFLIEENNGNNWQTSACVPLELFKMSYSLLFVSVNLKFTQ